MPHIEILQDVIKRLHGCESLHLMTIPVTEMFPRNTVDDGVVELFQLSGHLKAVACYAWSYVDGANVQHFSAVLKLHPVVSATTAVMADIVMRSKDSKEKA